MSSRTTSGRSRRGDLQRRRAVVGDARPRARTTCRSRARHRARRRRCRRRPGPACGGASARPCRDRAGRRPGRGIDGRRPAAGGRRTRCPRPARRCEAATLPAVQLHQACGPGSGRCRARPALRSSERSAWVNRSKTRGSSSGAMPMPVSRTRTTASSPSRSAVERDPAARLGVLGGVVQQVGEDLLQPGGSASSGTGSSGSETVSSWPRASISGRAVSTARATTSRGRPAPCGAGSCRW